MNDPVAVFNRHRSRLYGIAYRMLGTRADAEDMVQEAYLRWHRADVERLQAPEAWLVTATINGQSGMVAFDGRQPSWVLTIETDGVRILSAYAVVNPDKLKGIATLDALAGDAPTSFEGRCAQPLA